MAKPTILVQLDSDPHPSVFDAVVAIDAGVERLLQYGGIEVDSVQQAVYGAIFTRGPSELKQTAIFIGGSDVGAGEKLLERVTGTFFGPMRVSVMMDSNGSNTTAAAAVLAAAHHVELASAQALVLGATGPVGQRAVRLLAAQGCRVRIASRSRDRAQRVADETRRRYPQSTLEVHATGDDASLAGALDGVQAVIAAGAAGVTFLPAGKLQGCSSLRVAIDLNAVPPLGLADIEPQDRGTMRGSIACYGALGVGGMKMKIHKAAIAKLFGANDQILDAEQMLDIGQQLKL